MSYDRTSKQTNIHSNLFMTNYILENHVTCIFKIKKIGGLVNVILAIRHKLFSYFKNRKEPAVFTIQAVFILA